MSAYPITGILTTEKVRMLFRHHYQCIHRLRNGMKSCHIQFCDLFLGQ